MKVSEAEKLVCPFMQETAHIYGNTTINNTQCITSGCMAWKSTGTSVGLNSSNRSDKYVDDELTGYCQRLNQCD